MKFITFNDSPGGVYQSQVIDVCKFLQQTFAIKVELIAFVSARNYFSDRKKIKNLYPNSTVIPSYPGIKNWEKNRRLLKLLLMFSKKDKVIARGVFAANIALRCKKFSARCFDARAAYTAEWKEYLSSDSPEIAYRMHDLERMALFGSDFRLAVSNQLVEYWKKEHGYNINKHIVIPCTTETTASLSGSALRNKLTIKEKEILLVFSGSNAGWQSMNALTEILKKALTENPLLKLLLLSKSNSENGLSSLFPGRIFTEWVAPPDVPQYLNAADYGLLFREDTVTNRVSSPVKFAEYLAAGLPVIISEHVGDFSAFVKEQNCGFLFNEINWKSLERPSESEKNRIRKIAASHLSKSVYTDMYKQIVEMQ